MDAPKIQTRRGIVAAGSWICDVVKFIDCYPAACNLTTIKRIERGLGGCAHNVLADLAALKTELPLYAGGIVGCDSLGDHIMDEVKRMGIDHRYMLRTDKADTSYTDVMSEIGGSATRTFFHYCGTNALLAAEDILAIDTPAKIFHLGYLLLLDRLEEADEEYGIVAARVLAELQRKGYKTSVDVVSEQGDRFVNIITPCLPYVDYLIINEIEAGASCRMEVRNDNGEILLDEVAKAAHQLLDKGVGGACIVHFPEGGYALNSRGEEIFVPSDRVPSSEVVSSVGAGDAFCAGALYALHEDYPLGDVVRFANTSARFNLRGATSTDAAPTLKEIEEYLAEH